LETVWAPTWVVRLAANSFNIALLDIEALGYLEQICEKIIANRKSGSAEPSFIQTLVDSLVEAPKGHPDTLVDTNGLLWSKQGTQINCKKNHFLNTSRCTSFMSYYSMLLHILYSGYLSIYTG